MCGRVRLSSPQNTQIFYAERRGGGGGGGGKKKQQKNTEDTYFFDQFLQQNSRDGERERREKKERDKVTLRPTENRLIDDRLYSAILRSLKHSLRSHVVLHE